MNNFDPCSNHDCVFRVTPNTGMGTNGPCHCLNTKPKWVVRKFIRQQQSEIKRLRDLLNKDHDPKETEQ